MDNTPSNDPGSASGPAAEATKPNPILPDNGQRITKNAPLEPGFTLQKRPLTRPSAPKDARPRMTPIYVSTNASFMGIVRRAQKALDKDARQRAASSSLKGLPLQARIAALREGGGDEDQRNEIVLHGAGKACPKTLRLAAWFRRQRGYGVSLRTGTAGTVDGIVVEGGETYDGNLLPRHAGEERKGTQIRMVSVLQVGVRLV